jgi:kynurenine formamidase
VVLDDVLELLGDLTVVDLEQPRAAGDPVFPASRPGTIFTLHRRHELLGDEQRTSAAGMIVTAEHAGTHIDALCHQAVGLVMHGNVAVTPETQTPTGFRKLGVETIAPIVSRGVLLDVARVRGEPLAARSFVTVDDVEAAVEHAGVDIRAGDAVLLRTGNGARWAEPEAYTDGPGVSTAVSRWLADRQVAAVGADNLAWDLPGYRDPELDCTLPGHVVLIVERGIYIVESLYLEELSRLGATEFVFVCLPLKIGGGTGCPVRPIALVPR